MFFLLACADPQGDSSTAVPLHIMDADVGAPAYSAVRYDDGVIEEQHAVGTDVAESVSDVLFVLDFSPSMADIAEQVRAGYLAIMDERPFPARSEIAITSMQPLRARRARLSPGVGALVDADAIAKYSGGAFPYQGCEAWFHPDDADPDGVPCLVAHAAGASNHVEAGIEALYGLIDASTEPMFRPGATVDVIFVTDTQDPGSKPDPAYERPTVADLRDVIAIDDDIAALRLNAIRPATDCLERWPEQRDVYGEYAAETQGQTLDICTATPDDYVDFMRRVASEADRTQTPTITLSRPADAILSVDVDGQPVAWHRGVDRRTVVLDSSVARGRATVRYRK